MFWNTLLERAPVLSVQRTEATPPQASTSARGHKLLVAALLLLMFAQGLWNCLSASATWDEALYVGVGRYLLLTGSYDFAHIPALIYHPVGSYYLNSLFLLFLPLPADTLQIPADDFYTNVTAHRLLFHSGYAPETILLLARLPILLQSLLLGWLVYCFAARLFGPRAGLVALAALAFEPNLLAHSCLVTTDSSVTVWVFATAYAYWLYLRAPSTRRLLVTALCLGLAALAKVTGPALCLILLAGMYLARRKEARRTGAAPPTGSAGLPQPESAERVRMASPAGTADAPRGPEPTDAKPLHSPAAVGDNGHSAPTTGVFPAETAVPPLAHFLWMGIALLLMIWAAYGFNLGIHHPSRLMKLPGGPYLYMLRTVIQGGHRAGFSYLFGHFYPHGLRAYCSAVFLIKTPLPLLLLLLLTLLFWRRLPHADRAAEVGLALGFLIPLLLSLQDTVNLGLRYILPLYPFLCVFVSRLAALRRLPQPARLRWAPAALTALLCWQAVESVLACPNHLAYFNTLFALPAAHKYRYLVESNLDWGQELLALRAYMRAHHLEQIALQYYGSVDPAEYGIRYTPARPDSTGYVAIGATNLAGIFLPQIGKFHYVSDDPARLAAFRNQQPLAVLNGGAMLVYYVPPSDR
ncbi:MAG TPA: glycosyltransferase family 39 protein [Chthonomonadaceae bacterium]|nr:glycosyltransferase family 39 protein [Chthonomonadaceae bacterium]